MSAFTDAVDAYKEQMTELGIGIDEILLAAIAKGLGPSIYNQDSSLVAASDQEELDRVQKNFLVGKLGLTDGPELSAAIAEVAAQMKPSRRKYRAVFYYLLVQKFGKEAIYL